MNNKSSSGQIQQQRPQDAQRQSQEASHDESQALWWQMAGGLHPGHHKVNSMPTSSPLQAQQLLQGQRTHANQKRAQVIHPQQSQHPQVIQKQHIAPGQKQPSRGASSQHHVQLQQQQRQSVAAAGGAHQKHLLIAQGASAGHGALDVAHAYHQQLPQPTNSVKAGQRQTQKGMLLQATSKGLSGAQSGATGTLSANPAQLVQVTSSSGNVKGSKKAKVMMLKNAAAGLVTQTQGSSPQPATAMMVTGARSAGYGPSPHIAMPAQASMVSGQASNSIIGVGTATNQLGGSSHIVMNQQQHVKMRQAAKYAYGGGSNSTSGPKGGQSTAQPNVAGTGSRAAGNAQVQHDKLAARAAAPDEAKRRLAAAGPAPGIAASAPSAEGFAPTAQPLSPAQNFGLNAGGKAAKEGTVTHVFGQLNPTQHKKSHSLMNQKMMQLLLTQDPPSHCPNPNDFNNQNKEQISAQILKSQQLGNKPNTFNIDSAMIKTVDEARKMQQKQGSFQQHQVPQQQLQQPAQVQPAQLYHHFKSKSLVQNSDFVMPPSAESSNMKPTKQGQSGGAYLLTQASQPKVINKPQKPGSIVPMTYKDQIQIGASSAHSKQKKGGGHGSAGHSIINNQPEHPTAVGSSGVSHIKDPTNMVKIKGKHISSSFDNTAAGNTSKHPLQPPGPPQQVHTQQYPFNKQRQVMKQQSFQSSSQGQQPHVGKALGGKIQSSNGLMTMTGGGNVGIEGQNQAMHDGLVGVPHAAQGIVAGAPILLAHGGGIAGGVPKLQKKRVHKARQGAGHPAGGHVRTVGIPSGVQSALVTQGNVTQGPVTGAQTNMKQSFSDLNLVLENPNHQGAGEEMDVVSDGMQGSQHLHSAHNHQLLAGGGGLLSGVQQPQHLRTKSDANYIQELHAQNNKNTFIISSANHVYQSKKAANLKTMTSNNQVSSQGATKGLLKFNQQKQSAILSHGKNLLQKNLASAGMHHPHGQVSHGQTQQPRVVQKQPSTGLKKLGPQSNKGAFSAVQVGSGTGAYQQPHHKKNQNSVATSASNYKHSINSLSNHVVPKIATAGQSSHAPPTLKLSHKPAGNKKGIKPQKKQVQRADAGFFAQEEVPGAAVVDLEAFSGNQNKTTEQKYAELQLRFNDLTQKYVALAAQKTEDNRVHRASGAVKEQKHKQQHSQSYYGQLESQLLHNDQMISLHSSTFQPVHPQTEQQTLEPPQIMMIDQASSSNGGGPAHHSRGPSMGPRPANICHSGATSRRHQGSVNFQLSSDAVHQQQLEMPDHFDHHMPAGLEMLQHHASAIDEGDIISSGMATAERHKPVYVQNFEINDRRPNHFLNNSDSHEQLMDMDNFEGVVSSEYINMNVQSDAEAAETELARIIASQNVSYNVTPRESLHASMRKNDLTSFQPQVIGGAESGPVSQNASLSNLIKGGCSVDRDAQGESQMHGGLEEENLAVLDLAVIASQEGGSPTIPSQGVSRMEALAVPGEFLPNAHHKKNYNLTEELAQPNNTLQKAQHHARASMKKNAGTHHSGISRLSSGSGRGQGQAVGKSSGTMTYHKRSVSDGGIFNNVGLKAKAMQVAAKNNNQSFFNDINGAAQSSNRGSILQPYNPNYSGSHSGHHPQPAIPLKDNQQMKNTFEQRIHEMRLQNGLNVSSASSQGTVGGQSSNGGHKPSSTHNAQRYAAGRFHQGPQMMIVEEGDDEHQERTATQNTQQSMTSYKKAAGSGYHPTQTREDEENIHTEVGQEHHTTEHHDLRVKPSGSQSNLMQMVKNQRMRPDGERALNFHGKMAHGQVEVDQKPQKRKYSINFGLEASVAGPGASNQHNLARTPNMAQKGAQRSQALQEARNHSSSSKHLKSIQNKKIVAKKGPVGAQSDQHPNKPNQTRIARRSKERGDTVKLMEDLEPVGQLQAPPVSSTPDMDINKIAKRYKILRKAGEYQGGRTVIGMSSHVAERPQVDDHQDGRDRLLRQERQPHEPQSMQDDLRDQYQLQAPTPQGQGKLAVGEILQQPLRVKGQHRRVKSNAADNSTAVVGLGQVARQSQYQGDPRQVNNKNGAAVLASAQGRAHNPKNATYAQKRAGEGAVQNRDHANGKANAPQGHAGPASRSGQTSLHGSQKSLRHTGRQEDGESRCSWRRSREASKSRTNDNEGPMMIYQDRQQNQIDMNLLSECLPGDGTVDDSIIPAAHPRGMDFGTLNADTGDFGDGAALYPDGHGRKVINVSFNDFNQSVSNEYEDSFPPENSRSRHISAATSVDNSPTPATASAANNPNMPHLLLSNNQNGSNQKLNNFLEALQKIKPQNPVAKQQASHGPAHGSAVEHQIRAKGGAHNQGGIVVMDQVTMATRAANKGTGVAKSVGGPAMSGLSDKLRVEKYQKMMQKHQVSNEGPSITTVQHQRLKSTNEGGIMKPGQVRDKRHANHSMDRQAVDESTRVPKYIHKAGHSEIPPSVGVSLGIPASTTGQDSAKNFKISFVGDQALLRQHQRKNSKHKASKSNANAVHKSPIGGSTSNNLSSLVPSKQSFHNKIQFHAPVSSGKAQHFLASSVSGTGSNTAAQPSPIISTKRVPQKILDATITGSLSPKNERRGAGAAQRGLVANHGKKVSKSGAAGAPSVGTATPGIRSTTAEALKEQLMQGDARHRQVAGGSKIRKEVQHNNFMQFQDEVLDDRLDERRLESYQPKLLPDQANDIDHRYQDEIATSMEPRSNIDLDDTIEESAHLQLSKNHNQGQSVGHQRMQSKQYQKKSQKQMQPTQSQKPRARRQGRGSQGHFFTATQNSQEQTDREDALGTGHPLLSSKRKSASSRQQISIVDEAELCGHDEQLAPNTERKTLIEDESDDRFQMIHNLNKQANVRMQISDLSIQDGRGNAEQLSQNTLESNPQQQIRVLQQYPVPRGKPSALESKRAHNSPTHPLCAPQVSERLVTEESNGASNLTPRARQIRKLIKLIKLSFRSTGQPPDTTIDFYRIGKILGKGAFGKVNLAVHKLTQCLCAVKSINKQFFSDESQTKKVMQEVVMLKKTRHKNIVRLYEYFETEKHILFVIEVCAGGDLLNYVRRRRRLKEDLAKCLFKQIIESLAYCHSKNILHRDIKLDNILLDANGQVKLCDFGVGKIVKKGEKMTEQCGTPAYIAPEILRDQGYFGFAVDIWSSGVVLFAMLYGTVPFKANNMTELQQIIMKADYKLKEDISAEARDLLKGLLEPEPHHRLTVAEILSHPWMHDVLDPSEVELFTEQEKQYIKTEFTYGKSTRLGRNGLGLGLMGLDHHQQDMMHNSDGETLLSKDLFTEHQLDSTQNSILKNCETKSVILAPFNSTKSNLDQNGECQNFVLSDSVKALIETRRIIKFGPRVRDIDKQYEINNNADLDNGVYHKCDEDEEGGANKQNVSTNEDAQLMENQPQEGKDMNDTERRRLEGEMDSDMKMINFLENNQENGELDEEEQEILEQLKKQGQKKEEGKHAKQSELQRLEDMIQDQEKQERMTMNENEEPYADTGQGPGQMVDNAVKLIHGYSTPDYDAGGGNVVTENSNHQIEADHFHQCYTNGSMEEFFKKDDQNDSQPQKLISIDIQGQSSPDLPKSNQADKDGQMKIIECGTEESPATSPKQPSYQSTSLVKGTNGKSDHIMLQLLQQFHSEEQIDLDHHIIDQVEEYGYSRDFIIKSLKNRDLNSAATSYLLLHFRKRSDGRQGKVEQVESRETSSERR